jgi:hypothetical protein
MKLEFERTKVELKIYGEIVEITMPTEGQVLAMQEEVASAGDDLKGMLRARRNMLIGLGIPEATLDKMEFAHVNKLVEGLMGEIGKKS